MATPVNFNKLNIGMILGQGSGGKVFQVNNNYACKIYNSTEEISTIRELSILSEINHPNIIKPIKINIYENLPVLIMEKANSDLESVIIGLSHTDRPIIIWQILNALDFLHSNNMAHRDIKPHNILLFDTMKIKICDFGLSKFDVLSGITHTPNIVTLPYRPPEVILNPGNYNLSVDIWSVGVILLRMIFKNDFPFRSEVEIYHMFLVFQLIGTPTEEMWPGVSTMKNWKPTFPNFVTGNLDDLLKKTDASDMEKDILKKMLQYPNTRINAKKALEHPYFSEHAFLKDLYKVEDSQIFKEPSLIIHYFPHTIGFYSNREILFSWLYDISKECRLDYSTLFTAFNIFNEYIKINTIEKKYIQLLGIVCLDIASKLLELFPLSITEMMNLCLNCYTPRQFKKTLIHILNYFNFNITPMIFYNKIDNSEEILLIIISYCLTNKTIIETWNITKIINISKMLINKEISEDTNFLLSSVKHMSICSIKQSIETFFKV
jgi:serine/threonine protein kinase